MKEIRKEYGTPEEFTADAEQMLKVAGAMLSSNEAVSAREALTVAFILNGKEVGKVGAEVVYSAPAGEGFQLGVEFKGDWQKELESALEKAKSTDTDSKWGKDSESLYHQVQQMQTHEKIAMAIKGNREERRILMKDSHYMVHPYVLKNPRITTEEVAHFARMPSLTSEMIKTITDNSEWMNNGTVRLAIVKNPKTPANVVQKHIGHLGDSDLMQIAKSGNVRDTISKMAVKVLAGRGKHVR